MDPEHLKQSTIMLYSTTYNENRVFKLSKMKNRVFQIIGGSVTWELKIYPDS